MKALVATALLALPPAEAPLGYYRFPTLHADTIVFAAEGDLWRVPRSGGTASRLTSHPADEAWPAISPDGSTLAFSAAYEGPTDVYTMPLAGGPPVRRTFGEEVRVAGWTPDGKVLYATRRYFTLPYVQLVRYPFQGSHTKRYRGGTAQNIWKLADGAGEAVPLTAAYPGTSKTPMSWKGRIYFASDRDGTMNLWSCPPRQDWRDGSDAYLRGR